MSEVLVKTAKLVLKVNASGGPWLIAVQGAYAYNSLYRYTDTEIKSAIREAIPTWRGVAVDDYDDIVISYVDKAGDSVKIANALALQYVLQGNVDDSGYIKVTLSLQKLSDLAAEEDGAAGKMTANTETAKNALENSPSEVASDGGFERVDVP